MTCDWRDLPFAEIWVVDFEFHPGAGYAAGARDGDAPTPLCLCALELRTARTIELWRDEFGPSPPYSVGPDTLFVSFFASAEYGCHVALTWPKPAKALDCYVEFRQHVNDARVVAGDRDRGFYSLDGALRFFRADGLDTTHKSDMRGRILQGPPFSANERREILAYCMGDVRALGRLFEHIVPTIRSLPHACYRADYAWAIAQQERRGIPVDLPTIERLRACWDSLRLELVAELDQPFGVYEIENGTPHWRTERFNRFVRENRIAWPTYANGEFDLTADTFSDMATLIPALEPLRELRASLASLRLNSLQVGHDGRNRALLSPFGSKTGRNQPRASHFIFGPSKWTRFLITPPPGLGLAHRDYCQQEVQIAAVLSGDGELMAACASGDVYLGVAKQLGLAPEDATAETHGEVRSLFKTVVLGISYGLGARSLAARTGVSLFEAAEILARLRARFHRFEGYMSAVADHAGLQLELSTPFGWRMQCPPGTNPRTIRNFPMQSTGAEILHVAGMLAERRGIRVVAPVHDALMVEAPVENIEDASSALDRCMRDASSVVLRGYELRTDEQIIRPGGRFYDKRGETMWTTVNRLLAKNEKPEAV
jgi:DNA polymerase I